MEVHNINSPRYVRMDGPVTEDFGKVNFYLDTQSWCTFMCTERTGSMVIGLEKHETLVDAKARLHDMHYAQEAPPRDEIVESIVTQRILGGLGIEDEV